MHLDQLYYFAETVKAKSISTAACRLHISQPALSMTIKSLEDALGQPLLIRTNRGVMPTPLGERVYADYQLIQKMVDSWSSPVDDYTIQEQIHVGCIACGINHLLHQIIIPFNSLYANIDVVIHELRVSTAIRSLKNSPCNIVVTSLPPFNSDHYLQQAQEQGFQVHNLYTDERRLLIGITHPLAHKETLASADLKSLSIAYYSSEKDVISTSYAPYFASLRKMPNRESIMELVVSNKVAFIPIYHLLQNDYYLKNQLVKAFPLPITEIDSHVPIVAITGGQLSRAEGLLCEYLLTHFAQTLH